MSYTINATDFENLKLALMNSYSSQTIAHVGYIIGLAVGIAAILYQVDFKNFSKDFVRWKRILFFYIPLGLLSGMMVFMVFREIYWSWMSGEVLRVPYSDISNLLATSTDPTYTPAFAIQSYCTTHYPSVGGLSSFVFSLYYNSLNMYIVLIVLFSLPVPILATIIDYLWGRSDKWWKKRKALKTAKEANTSLLGKG